MGGGLDRADHEMIGAMIGAIHTAIGGWDVIAGLAVVLVGVILDRTVKGLPWVAVFTLFGVALLVFALLVAW